MKSEINRYRFNMKYIDISCYIIYTYIYICDKDLYSQVFGAKITKLHCDESPMYSSGIHFSMSRNPLFNGITNPMSSNVFQCPSISSIVIHVIHATTRGLPSFVSSFKQLLKHYRYIHHNPINPTKPYIISITCWLNT